MTGLLELLHAGLQLIDLSLLWWRLCTLTSLSVPASTPSGTALHGLADASMCCFAVVRWCASWMGSHRAARRAGAQINYANKAMLVGALIVAGWDAARGGQVYGVPIGGTLVRQRWTTDGSGSTYLWGYLDAEYKRAPRRAQP